MLGHGRQPGTQAGHEVGRGVPGRPDWNHDSETALQGHDEFEYVERFQV